MEINKLIVLFESYREKEKIINKIILPYRFFIEGYYTTEIREKNKLQGYKVNFINEDTNMILASTQIVSDISYNKYAIDRETLKKISEKIKTYPAIPHKIIMVEIGSIYLLEPEFSNSFIKFIASDKKSIIFARKTKEIESTVNKLYDAVVVELTKKKSENIKKLIDKFIGELVSRMEINE